LHFSHSAFINAFVDAYVVHNNVGVGDVLTFMILMLLLLEVLMGLMIELLLMML